MAQSRTAPGLRRIAPEYKRLTFDKSIVTRPRLSEEDASLPAAELCGPGHPLFDALVRYVAERSAPEVAKGAVFFDPDIDEPVVLRFLIGDVVDGNGEIVSRTLAAARIFPNGRTEQAPATSLFDVVPPTDTARPAPEQAMSVAAQTDPQLVMWARQHLFERVYEEARAERGHVAAIQEDFLKRSFNALIAQADAAILAAEDEKDRGVPGADGRLRRAEITKAQHDERRRQRLEDTERGRAIVRGDVTVIGSALLLPSPCLTAARQGQVTGTGSATVRSSRSQCASPASTRSTGAQPSPRSSRTTSASTCCPCAAWSAAASRSRDGLGSPGWS